MKRFAVGLMCMVALSCNTNTANRFSRETTVMETYLTVTIYDDDMTQARAQALIDSTFIDMQRIERMMTDYSDSGEVGRVNLSAGKDSVEVSDELRQILLMAQSFSEASAGAFDVTVGPLVKAWNFLSATPDVPPLSIIQNLTHLVGFRDLAVVGKKVLLRKPGMRLDLGGIAKGYAVDRSIEILKRNGVKNAIVDLGGNLGVWWEGTHMLDSSVAEILIRHPRKEGQFFGSFNVGTAGVSTSGDYQRYFLQDGVRYHHLINPATGYPANELVSVTIVATDATQADALSTLVFVLGRKKGMEFIEQSSGVEGLIVWEENGALHYNVSTGLKGKFKRLND